MMVDMTGGSDGGMMDASSMNMVFYSSTSTALYSNTWVPQNAGQYAGTCIFLIVLGVVFRSLVFWKSRLERKWVHDAWNRRYVVVQDAQPISERVAKDPDNKSGVLMTNGVEEKVKVVTKSLALANKGGVMPWRFTTDLPRALLFTAIAGVGYLLMLAVMTQNVGYFFSVLAGIFVGELSLGRFISVAEDHQH